MTDHTTMRRLRFQLQNPGWRITRPAESSESGQWQAQREALTLTAALLGDLLDELEQWEIMSAPDQPVSVPQMTCENRPGEELPRRVSGQHRRV